MSIQAKSVSIVDVSNALTDALNKQQRQAERLAELEGKARVLCARNEELKGDLQEARDAREAYFQETLRLKEKIQALNDEFAHEYKVRSDIVKACSKDTSKLQEQLRVTTAERDALKRTLEAYNGTFCEVLEENRELKRELREMEEKRDASAFNKDRTFVVHMKVTPQGTVVVGPPEGFEEFSFFADDVQTGAE